MTPLRSKLNGMDIDLSSLSVLTSPSQRKDETPEEKRARRKEERRKRTTFKQLKAQVDAGKTPTTITAINVIPKAMMKEFNRIFDAETEFVLGVQQALPEVKNPHLFDHEEEQMDSMFFDDDGKAEEKRKKFLAKMKQNRKGEPAPDQKRALTHEELRARLHAKIAELSSQPNEKKRLRKQKKRELKKKEEMDGASKKKFISKANPNLKNQQKGESSLVKEEGPGGLNELKTPLRKKPVVKSNGEIVYSKFDFISEDKRGDGPAAGKKPKPEDLLKRVNKTQHTVTKLEQRGKAAEAASLVETQKWDSALRRAQGEKIRDDPTLLKKTIKKQEKKKQVSKKKWQERTDRVEKQKEAKQDKRKANLQAKKEEKVKKNKKQQRKKGRIA